MSSPALSTGRSAHRALINKVAQIAPNHFQLQLRAPLLARCARPGQFVHVLTAPGTTDWNYDPLLRRAFSIMSVEESDQESFTILFRVEGRGTRALAEARVGDEIDVLGPLGRPFDLSPFDSSSPNNSFSNQNMFHVKQPTSNAILVGGGVGVPPLVYLAQVLRARDIRVSAIIGARGSAEIIGFDELAGVAQSVAVATDDGSRGHQGRVTDLLATALDAGKLDQKERPVVYACGPLPMLRTVAQLCATAKARCQVSLEENMPCGIGVCNGCVVRTRQPFASDEKDGKLADELTDGINPIEGSAWSPYRAYRRICVEGPACWADEIEWDYQG